MCATRHRARPQLRVTLRPYPGQFLGSLVLFALVLLAANNAAKVGILVGVVLLHELGHYAGMRLFGYRDVRIFFIPFFGAAASGVKERAPVWQQGRPALDLLSQLLRGPAAALALPP